MFIVRHNPHAAVTQRRTLGDLGAAAQPGPLDAVAKSLNTPVPSMLLLVGAGLVAGWWANDFWRGAKRTSRKVARTPGRAARAVGRAAKQGVSELRGPGGDRLLEGLVVGGISIGLVVLIANYLGKKVQPQHGSAQ